MRKFNFTCYDDSCFDNIVDPRCWKLHKLEVSADKIHLKVERLNKLVTFVEITIRATDNWFNKFETIDQFNNTWYMIDQQITKLLASQYEMKGDMLVTDISIEISVNDYMFVEEHEY